MPTYAHICQREECQHEWDDFYSIKNDPPTHCVKCNEPSAKRLISGGCGRGVVELTGNELKEHLKAEAKKEAREIAGNPTREANFFGDSKYQATQVAKDRVMRDIGNPRSSMRRK